jgi:hypothetical protein
MTRLGHPVSATTSQNSPKKKMNCGVSLSMFPMFVEHRIFKSSELPGRSVGVHNDADDMKAS